jgi:hypothetical protein
MSGGHDEIYGTFCHWDRCVRKVLHFSKQSTWGQILRRIGSEFTEEIGGSNFRLYSLPKKSVDVNDRVRIQSIGQLTAVFKKDDDDYESGSDRDELYVFNCNDESPTKIPENIQDNLTETSGRSYRSKATAQVCRIRDGNKCVFCDYSDGAEMQHCHFFGLAEFKDIKQSSDRIVRLLSLGLGDINDIRNVICLCRNCHTQWDQHNIGVHSENSTLLTVEVGHQKIKYTQGGTKYSELANKVIVFAEPQPSKAVLEYRYELFKSKLAKAKTSVSSKAKKSVSSKAKTSVTTKAKKSGTTKAKKSVTSNAKKSGPSNAKKPVTSKAKKSVRSNAKKPVHP